MTVSPQLTYALKKVGIMIALAALGVVGVEVTNVINVAGVDATIWGPIAGALIAGAVRAVEGQRDAQRAEEGKIIKADVGFEVIKDELAEDPMNNNVVQTNKDTIYVNNPAMSGPGAMVYPPVDLYP